VPTRNIVRIAISAATAILLVVVATQVLKTEAPRRGASVAPQQNEIEIKNAPLAEHAQPVPAINTGTSSKNSGLMAPDTSPDFDILDWLSSEYDAVFGYSEPSSPLEKVHVRFTDEPRDESWASAMESGISQALVRSDATARMTVEYVRCHSTICEVAGFMPDRMKNPQLDPYSLFPNDLGAGWWQGRIDFGIGTHTYGDEGITRFIVIIAEPEIFLSASK